jgi:hypothetical protein
MARFTALRLFAVAAALMALLVFGPSAQAASSEQVVFSKTGAFGSFGPFGFWIWCEADSANPYASFCNGSIYFYAIGHPEHVTGTISELAEDMYRMSVHSADWSCTLTNVLPVMSGPTNTIDVACTSPVGGGTATGSIVNVTGP